MASTAAERQKERHNKKLSEGFKKRAFYVDQKTIDLITRFKDEHELESLDDALCKIVKNTLTN